MLSPTSDTFRNCFRSEIMSTMVSPARRLPHVERRKTRFFSAGGRIRYVAEQVVDGLEMCTDVGDSGPSAN